MSHHQNKKEQLVMQIELQRVAYKVTQKMITSEIQKLRSMSFLIGSAVQEVKSIVRAKSMLRSPLVLSLISLYAQGWGKKNKWVREVSSVRTGYGAAKRIVFSLRSLVKKIRKKA
jgi:predicted RNase H-like nuclease